MFRVLGLVALVVGGSAAADSLTIEGSELVARSGDVVRRGVELEGATLTVVGEDGQPLDVRIDRVMADPQRPEGDVWLYDLSLDDGGKRVPVCEPEHDGAPHAILQPQEGKVAILCTAGALAKCIRFGYRPWADRGGVALMPYWRACVAMVRADYCGDGTGTTRDNMLIELHDRLGINTATPTPGLTFEAAWGAEGALCVAHPRVPQNITLDALAAACPRLADSLGPTCTEAATASRAHALIFESSRGDGIPEPGN